MKDNELKPCPHCGNDKVFKHYYPIVENVQSVKVLEVVCYGCNSKTYFLDKDEKPAIEAWNRRDK